MVYTVAAADHSDFESTPAQSHSQSENQTDTE